ncbi:aminofutalosine synthase MqnE [Oceanidesulfovibrio indonesiensis]|uniref:Aminodeoxyfutalosine synthase n=1 Tax=Oceanidesulfovibrio indonesiensis TaxID=54767 RepID=A0A7M3MEJ5_9BACT|nr:aminofutalosine synthase MqnE [Oceanidesulfovibrio indonesiensis]TVM16668.1 aminofutalosine synthase MqnE [Oceanidesulfovibrio indonesiensis]
MLNPRFYESLGMDDIREKVVAGERLSLDDGLRLFECPDLSSVAALAHYDRMRRHAMRVTWVRNRHVNYTNVCANNCRFCAFHRKEGEEGGFTLSLDDILDKATSAGEITELHVVGGCHPDLGLDFFVNVLRALQERLPDVSIKAFTPVEIEHFAMLESISTREVLERLRASGLKMMPGGGAEIFHPEIRERICPDKVSGDEWLRISREAHSMGMRTNCTMLFGHVEDVEHRIDHLDRLRRLQDETGGFVCFIPLPFLTKNSALELPEGFAGVSALDILRTIAVSRLMLDNIPHIKAYWVMLGVKLALTALHYGADDFDGTVVEEKIGHMAGASSEQALTPEDIEAMARDCGFSPTERDALFQPKNAVAPQGEPQC